MVSPRPGNPTHGDIHLTADYPNGTDPRKITEFEVWDGCDWVHARDQHKIFYVIQPDGSVKREIRDGK